MPSELKSETARINGAKSHGPKTPEGKEASSRNSIKHGMTARNTYILECESKQDFQEFWAEHIEIHQPVTAPEKELVEQMAIARWRIRRFVNAETVLIDCEVVRNRGKVEKEFATKSCAVHVAMAIRSLADESRCLSLMSRYEARHQRTHDKAYAALRELQKVSQTASEPPPAEPAPFENEILPNEPTAPPDSSPDIHLCPPLSQVPPAQASPEPEASAADAESITPAGPPSEKLRNEPGASRTLRQLRIRRALRSPFKHSGTPRASYGPKFGGAGRRAVSVGKIMTWKP